MTMTDDAPRPVWLPELDFRGVTRDSHLFETRIDVVHHGHPFPWLVFGELSKVSLDDHPFLGAYFRSDIRDDSCKPTFALFFDVVGLQLTGIRNSLVTLRAYVSGAAGQSEHFQVPSVPYDVTHLGWCPHCKGLDRHQLFSDELKADRALWKRIRGAELRITLGKQA